MLGRTLAEGADAILLAVSGFDAAAREPIAPDTQAGSAPKPAADTKEPGKTATDAVTNPAAVPPSEEAIGTGNPPQTSGATTGPPSGSTPVR